VSVQRVVERPEYLLNGCGAIAKLLPLSDKGALLHGELEENVRAAADKNCGERLNEITQSWELEQP